MDAHLGDLLSDVLHACALWGAVCNIHTFVDRSNFCPTKLLLSDKNNFVCDKSNFVYDHIMFAPGLAAQAIHYVIRSTCDLRLSIVLLVGDNTSDST